MTNILFITVGGSPQPIVTAVQSLNPDRVIFICSDGPRGSVSQITGEGTPCEIRRGAEVVSRLPNIPTQLGLGDRTASPQESRFNPDTDLVLLDNPDDLAEGYRRISDKIRAVQRDNPTGQFYADYTGGTKTMSLALGMAALDYDISLFLTTSATRENLIRVERGESTERAPTTLVMIDRTLNQVLPIFLEQYNYPAAIAQLRTLLQAPELPSEQKRRIRELLNLCAGLDAWDRFDHAGAWQLLEPQMKHVQSLGLFLKRVISSRAAVDPSFQNSNGIPGHGYEIVEDLLLNAERRAKQERYDDAVGRIYRALELLAQIRLRRAHEIDTGDVKLDRLPETLRATAGPLGSAHSDKIQLALRKSYDLLSQLPDDPLGQLYQERAKAILDTLLVRNQSLFAHGFRPITARDYQQVHQVMGEFIKAGIAVVAAKTKNQQPVQFPGIL